MKPPRFDYVRADDLGEVHALLAEHGSDARVVAGGQTLLPMLSMRLVRPKLVVDIMHLPALRTIAATGNEIRIGAGVRQAELLRGPGLLKIAAAGGGVAVGRSRANAQPRHRVRIGGACRPECGNSAGIARARRRGRADIATAAPARCGERVLHRHHDHRAGRSGTHRGRGRPEQTARPRLRIPRIRAPSRRLCHCRRCCGVRAGSYPPRRRRRGRPSGRARFSRA